MLKRTTPKHRAAFTLMELMIVVAIIAALMALTASAVVKYVGIQEESNTNSTLNKVQSVLNRGWSKVKDQANQETIPSAIDTWIRANLAGSDPNATLRVRVIYIKLKERQAFPMSFAEALNPSPLPPLQAYVQHLANMGVTGSSAATANIESSACLLMALQRGVSGAGIDASELTRGGATGMFNGKIPYLTDAWNRPIFFARFPTGQLTPMAGANDPGDPQGTLQTNVWSGPYGTAYSSLLLQQLAPPGQSYKLAPMLASGGQLNWSKGGGTDPGFNTTTFAVTTNSSALFSTP